MTERAVEGQVQRLRQAQADEACRLKIRHDQKPALSLPAAPAELDEMHW